MCSSPEDKNITPQRRIKHEQPSKKATDGHQSKRSIPDIAVPNVLAQVMINSMGPQDLDMIELKAMNSTKCTSVIPMAVSHLLEASWARRPSGMDLNPSLSFVEPQDQLPPPKMTKTSPKTSQETPEAPRDARTANTAQDGSKIASRLPQDGPKTN